MITLTKQQVNNFFTRLSLVEKQINLDSTQQSNVMAFRTPQVDEDGDFGYSLDKIDLTKFEQCKAWLMDQLGWASDDLRLVLGNKQAYVQVKDAKQLMDFLQAHRDNSESIAQPAAYPKEAFFTMDTFDTTNLSGKGIAVLQNDYEQKEGKIRDVFIGSDKHLLKLFNMLAQAENNIKLTVNIRLGQAHWVPIHCIKKDGVVTIIEMDSEGTSKDYGKVTHTDVFQKIIQSNLNKAATRFYRTVNLRQSGPNNCGLFMVKDTTKIARSEDVLAEILPYVTNTQLVQGLSYSEYVTPPRYEKTVQDKKDLESYIRILRSLKQNVVENDLLNETFNKKRPLILSRVETGETPQHNKTIHYFKDKYVQRVKRIVDEKNKSELSAMVDEHSLETLSLERMNRCR